MRTKLQTHNGKYFNWFCRILVCLVGTVIYSQAVWSQRQQDSVKMFGSHEIGNVTNLLLERIQYKEGSLFRNDFVRDYSPLDGRTLRLDSEPSFAEELLYRDAGRKKEISLTMTEKTVSATLIPLLGGTYYASQDGLPYWKRSGGLAVTGSIGEDFVFYAKATENALRHTSPRIQDTLSVQPGYVTSTVGPNGYDYDDTEMQFGLKLGMVRLYFEKLRNTWGYGRGGQVVLSQRAPSYPQIRASIQLLHNLKFTVLASFLNSGIVDSNRSYTDYTYGMHTNFHAVDRSKYLFAHVLEYSPIDQMNFAIGEEMVVSDRFAPEYMILPIAFYHNLYIQGGGLDQTNIWGGARYTYPNLGSAYATLYVDDFNFNQGFYIVAGTIGATVVDIDHRKFDFTVEYTGLRPFVYANNITALYRTSDGYPLGDWLGQNGDRLQAWIDYRPIPQVWLSATYAAIRKGLPGTAAQEYGAGNYTYMSHVGFLEGPLFRRNEIVVRARWEIYSGLFADVSYRLITQSDQVVGRYESFSNRSFISCSLKLNIVDQNDES